MIKEENGSKGQQLGENEVFHVEYQVTHLKNNIKNMIYINVLTFVTLLYI